MIRHRINLHDEAQKACQSFLQGLELLEYFSTELFERLYTRYSQASRSAETIGQLIADEIIHTAPPQPLPEYC